MPDTKCDFFKGQIVLQDRPVFEPKLRKSDLMSFSLSEKVDHTLGEVLMYKFSSLKFSTDEKRILSKNLRKKIFAIQSIKTQELIKESEKLIAKINMCHNNTLSIKGHGYGAFLCLAAFFSGKLPKDKEVNFYLDSVPLALFPKHLAKKSRVYKSTKLHLSLQSTCWLATLKSLYKPDKSFNLKNVTFHEEPPISRKLSA